MNDKIYFKNSDVVFRKIANEFILVPIRQKVVNLKSIYTLNESAAFIWELLNGKNNTSQIKDRFSEEYEVEFSTAESDIEEILSQLESIGLIKNSKKD